MPHSQHLTEQFSITTLAAIEAAKQEDWQQLASLLTQRSSLIDQLSQTTLSPQQTATVKNADFQARELAALLTKEVKESKAVLGEGVRARTKAKNYRPKSPNAAYDLTG